MLNLTEDSANCNVMSCFSLYFFKVKSSMVLIRKADCFHIICYFGLSQSLVLYVNREAGRINLFQLAVSLIDSVNLNFIVRPKFMFTINKIYGLIDQIIS